MFDECTTEVGLDLTLKFGVKLKIIQQKHASGPVSEMLCRINFC
jgi:hypothetical protein